MAIGDIMEVVVEYCAECPCYRGVQHCKAEDVMHICELMVGANEYSQNSWPENIATARPKWCPLFAHPCVRIKAY